MELLLKDIFVYGYTGKRGGIWKGCMLICWL